jgi:hypothetical protein
MDASPITKSEIPPRSRTTKMRPRNFQALNHALRDAIGGLPRSYPQLNATTTY